MTELLLAIPNTKTEYIAKILFKPSLVDVFPTAIPVIPDNISIIAYSKEANILNKTRSQGLLLISGSSVEENEKLKRFCHYLGSRNKACQFIIANIEFYMLPITADSDVNEFETISMIPFATTGTITSSLIKSNNPSQTNIPPESFLGNLLSKASATQQARNLKANQFDSLKRQKIDHVHKLSERVKKQLEAFDMNSAFLEHHFEPMDKEDRYVIHEIAEEFPDLISVAIGEDSARHILVYRKGHQPTDVSPEELEIQLNKHSLMNGRLQSIPNSKKHKKSNLTGQTTDPAVLSSSMSNNLIELNVVKRDRRTTEELLDEIKKRKTA